MRKLVYILFIISSFSIGCATTEESTSENDTPTSGKISMAVDESLSPIAEAEVDIFQHQYPNAKVTIRQRSEADCVKELYDDSCKAIMVGRQLTPEEKKSFKSLSFEPPHLKIATDAIALIVHPNNRDTNMTFVQAQQVLSGAITNWSQLKGKKSGELNMVFDNQNSGTVSYILNLTGKNQMPANAYAAKSNLEAVNYVASHENAIGVIGWSWISDSDDPKTRDYLSKVRLVSLSPRENAQAGEYYKPYQLNLAQGKYPLSREVFLIQRERRNGLSAGFTAFVGGEIGQLILLKAGLLPANQSERWIEMKTKNIGKVK
jgi:phosphate transport system substrate-binding protein